MQPYKCKKWVLLKQEDHLDVRKYLSLSRDFGNDTAWKVSLCGVFSGPHFLAFGLNTRDTEYLSVFSPNAGKYGPEKTPYWTLFTQCEEKTYYGFWVNG